jgi:hypothetical protein
MFERITAIKPESLRAELKKIRSAAQLDNPDLYELNCALDILDYLDNNGESANFSAIGDSLKVADKGFLEQMLGKLVRGKALSLRSSYKTTSGGRSVSGRTYSLTPEGRSLAINARGYLAIVGSDHSK